MTTVLIRRRLAPGGPPAALDDLQARRDALERRLKGLRQAGAG